MATDLDSTIETSGPGFLGPLTPSILRHYPYKSRDQFLKDFDEEFDREFRSQTNEYFMVTGVTRQIMSDNFFSNSDKGSPFSSWVSYDAELELLLVRTFTGAAHEMASETFTTCLRDALRVAGMTSLAIHPSGRMEFHALVGDKRSNQSWEPVDPPWGRLFWPSAALQVVFSTARAKLHSDIHFWQRASQGEVKVILTLEISTDEPKIVIENWETEDDGLSHLKQRVTVSRDENGDTVVDEAPLKIRFEKMLLRPARWGEWDIEVGEKQLRLLAMRVWDTQSVQSEAFQ
ncbi:hypothetical protein BJX99DRAFT_21755 [Aspergillus californicus]